MTFCLFIPVIHGIFCHNFSLYCRSLLLTFLQHYRSCFIIIIYMYRNDFLIILCCRGSFLLTIPPVLQVRVSGGGVQGVLRVRVTGFSNPQSLLVDGGCCHQHRQPVACSKQCRTFFRCGKLWSHSPELTQKLNTKPQIFYYVSCNTGNEYIHLGHLVVQ